MHAFLYGALNLALCYRAGCQSGFSAWKGAEVGVHNHLSPIETGEYVEARRHPRYKLEIDVRIYARNKQVVRGHSVDISESGISAMLRVEVPLGEVVRLEFTLPTGEVEVHALVRQRQAFRYGFQFVEDSFAQQTIARACTQLAVEQALREDQIS